MIGTKNRTQILGIDQQVGGLGPRFVLEVTGFSEEAANTDAG